MIFDNGFDLSPTAKTLTKALVNCYSITRLTVVQLSFTPLLMNKGLTVLLNRSFSHFKVQNAGHTHFI